MMSDVFERLNRIIQTSVIPAALLVLVFVISFMNLPFFSGIGAWLSSAAFSVLGIGILLSLLARQSRLTFCCINLALAAWLLPSLAELGRPTDPGLASVITVVNLAIFGIQKNRGVFSPFGASLFGILSVEAAVLAVVNYFQPRSVERLLRADLLNEPLFGIVYLPDTTLLIGLLVLGVLGAQLLIRPGPLEAALFWSVLPLLASMNWIHDPDVFFAQLTGAGLMICAAILIYSSDIAFRDELTRLPSRRALEQYLMTLGRKYTIAMVDLDYFKKINDTYGHDIGDQVLKMVASQLVKISGAKAFRYGGEEFTLIFRRKSAEEALPHLERLRRLVQDYRMVLRTSERPQGRTPRSEKAKRTRGAYRRNGNRSLRITISIGVAARKADGEDPSDIIKAADEALYRAKKTGRNRICTA